jgi:acyl carrier protein
MFRCRDCPALLRPGPPVAAMQRSDIFCAPPRSGANLGFMVATKQNGETIVADHSVEWRAQLSGQDVRTRVFSLIAEHLHVDPTLLRDEALFVDELGADWLDRLELITAVERDFAIELPDQTIDDSVIVGDLIRIVERAVSGKSAI